MTDQVLDYTHVLEVCYRLETLAFKALCKVTFPVGSFCVVGLIFFVKDY